MEIEVHRERKRERGRVGKSITTVLYGCTERNYGLFIAQLSWNKSLAFTVSDELP